MNTELKVDKLSFTVPVHAEESKRRISKTLYTDSRKSKCKFHKRESNRTGYTKHYQYTLEGKQKFKLDIWSSPPAKMPRSNFLRLQFNPRHAGTNGFNNLEKLLLRILGKKLLSDLFYIAKITRLDICSDIPSTLEIYYPKLSHGRYSKIIRDEDGRIQSLISGSSKSKVRLTIYDKTAEARARGKKMNRQLSRLELRLRLSQPLSKVNLMTIATGLSKFKFLPSSELLPHRFSREFVESVMEVGLDTSLQDLERKERDRYRNAISRLSRDPWGITQLEVSCKHTLEVFERLSTFGSRDRR